jgi:hypothetical protein
VIFTDYTSLLRTSQYKMNFNAKSCEVFLVCYQNSKMQIAYSFSS